MRFVSLVIIVLGVSFLNIAQDTATSENSLPQLIEEAKTKMSEEKWEEACNVLLQALTTYQDNSDAQTVAYLNLLLGQAALRSELYHLSESSYSKALRVYRATDTPEDHWGRAQALVGLGHLSFALGNLDESLDYYTRAIGVLEALGDVKAEADATLHATRVLADLGNLKEAIAKYEEVQAAYASLNCKEGLLETYISLGDTYSSVGDYEKALSVLKKGLELAQGTNNTDYAARVIVEMGEVYRTLGRYEEALSLWQQAEEIFLAGQDLKALAQLYLKFAELQMVLGPYSELVSWVEKAVKALDLALEEIDGLPRVSGATWTRPATHVELLAAKAALLHFLSRTGEAKSCLEKAAEITDWAPWEVPPKSFRVYENLLDLLVKLDESEEALVWADHWRVRWLKNLYIRGGVNSPISSVSEADLRSLSSVLQPNEAVLSYVTGTRGVYIGVITVDNRSGSIKTWFYFSPYPHGDLVGDMEELRRLLLESQGAQGVKYLAQLYKALMEPALKALDSEVDTLVIVPHGVLWYLPFSALPMTDQPPVLMGIEQRWKYLVEDYAIALIPNLQALFTQGPPEASGRDQFAVLNYQPERAYLWSVEAISNAGHRLPGVQSLEVHETATINALKQAFVNARYLFLTLPVKPDFLHPWQSCFVLSDGHYSAREVVNESLEGMEIAFLATTYDALDKPTLGAKAESQSLTTLSTGQSGAPNREPDGTDAVIWPLTFITAGVPSILKTSWCSNPLALEELFDRLCQARAAGKTWAGALAKAQRDLIKHPLYSIPWFWAPYQLIGRWR